MTPESAPARSELSPRTWVLLGEKAGDNAQVLALAGALGWHCDVKRLAMQERWRIAKPRVRASIDHVDLARSDALAPPWPALVITAGRRLSSVALWIQEQSRGAARLVLVGWPRRLARRFDLIVASAQYRGRDAPNVLRIGLPLVPVDRAAIAAAGREWASRFAELRRPITAVLVGGPTKPVRFDAGEAGALVRRAAAVVEGGTLYVTTSRRTPPALVDAIEGSLPRGARLFRWRADATDNPYLGLLALADRFVVTSDSVTMLVEVARLGRPLAIHLLPPARSYLLRRFPSRRDLHAVPAWLVEHGSAVRLGDPFLPMAEAPPDEASRAAERIRSLL